MSSPLENGQSQEQNQELVIKGLRRDIPVTKFLTLEELTADGFKVPKGQELCVYSILSDGIYDSACGPVDEDYIESFGEITEWAARKAKAWKTNGAQHYRDSVKIFLRPVSKKRR
jgi:hypothetical protein